MKKLNVAIMGATGAVGQELMDLLTERKFPLQSLKLLASVRSKGKKIAFQNQKLIVEELTHESFKNIDLVLSSAGGCLSKEYVPSAIKSGAVVVDNTSYFRMDPKIPLVIPEINPEVIKEHQGIIANPNCTTIIMLLPLWPLQQKYGIKRLVVSTYQAASGAGAVAMDELEQETKALLNQQLFERSVMPHQYAFNLFPHNSPMMDNGYCEEEMKMVNETRKILNQSDFQVTATCVRVPILRAHCESINAEFYQPISVEQVYQELELAKGVQILENRKENRWPMPIDVSGKDPVLVGRVRQDVSCPNAIEMWVAGDQIRKGAALNAIQIAEHLQKIF